MVLFIKRGKWIAAVLAALCLALLGGCAAGTGAGGRPEIEDMYGSYDFEETVYMWPASSFMAVKGHMPTYTLTWDGLTIKQADGTQTVISGPLTRADFDEAAFKESFDIAVGVPDVSAYKSRVYYAVGDAASEPFWRVYQMDGEVWLASLMKDTKSEKSYFRSIYRLIKRTEAVAYTYPGNHAIASFTWPDGGKGTLILSQPVRQNSAGIWCVERWTDPAGVTHPVLPDTDRPAGEYYAKLQEESDFSAGQLPSADRSVAEFISNTLKLEPYPFHMSTYNDADLRQEQLKYLDTLVRKGARLWYQDDFRQSVPDAGTSGGMKLDNSGGSMEVLSRIRAMFANSSWVPATEEPAVPSGKALYLGDDSVNCFIFIPGTNHVTRLQDHVTVTYTADCTLGGTLTDLMLAEFPEAGAGT